MEIITTISLIWTAISVMLLVVAVTESLIHNRRARRPKAPVPPTPPLKPFVGTLLPSVKPIRVIGSVRNQAVRLDDWRDQQSLIANGGVGSDYGTLLQFEQKRQAH